MKPLTLRISEKAGISVVKRGDETYLVQLQDVEQFILTCAQEEVVINGIDTMVSFLGGVSPKMDYIADFSSLKNLPWAKRCKQSVESARLFLREAAEKEAMFDFGLLEK